MFDLEADLPAVVVALEPTWAGTPDGRDWLDRLPQLVRACLHRWALNYEGVFTPSIAYVARVRSRDGHPAVLKVNKPEAESAEEADALVHWAGNGAVRLLDTYPDAGGLLLERLFPGNALRELPEEIALAVAGDVLSDLRRPAPPSHPFRVLDDVALDWSRMVRAAWESHDGPFERSLLDLATDQLAGLIGTAPEKVVLHQDLHSGNILLSQRGWLAIDPKPYVGDPAFDPGAIIRDRRELLMDDPDAVRKVATRLDVLSTRLGLDRERMRGWAIVHALELARTARGFDPILVAAARWLARA